MPLLTASNLSKSFGPLDIFSGVSLSIPHGARVALVGPNGIGKTTLLRILIGEEEPTSGKVHRARGIRIGYLPQEAHLASSLTLWEECLKSFSDLQRREAELTELEKSMIDPHHAEKVLLKYGELQAEFERLGGYTYENRTRQVLSGLGFSEKDFQRPLTQLSGGQRTRALLAKLLLSDPDLLALDEPTNHLDVAAVEWLEGYLRTWQGAALIISHDRYFLDQVVDHICELNRSGLEAYRGNYSAYLNQRQERWQLRQELFEAERQRLEKELDYIKRNIAGQRTQQAKGRLRRLSRQVEAIESVGLETVLGKNWLEVSTTADISTNTMGVAEVERRIKALKPPGNRPPVLNIHLKAVQRSGDIVLRASQAQIGYPGNPLFSIDSLELRRLECAAIIGPNGSGKTTFLKTVLGELPPLSGEFTLGASLITGYFAQAHEGLVEDRMLVEEIESVAPHLLPGEIRDHLARFLFTGDDVFRKVATLSGGERGRLALAKLSLTNANLLLLDEPTNHLDIPSQEVLQEVLAQFQGTILLVSHDRYLIDALATQVWEIDPVGKHLRVFAGNYARYRAALEAERAEAEKSLPPALQKLGTTNRGKTDGGRSSNIKKRRARLAEIEANIARLEAELSELASRLENPPTDPDLVRELGQAYVALENDLDRLLSEWGELNADLSG